MWTHVPLLLQFSGQSNLLMVMVYVQSDWSSPSTPTYQIPANKYVPCGRCWLSRCTMRDAFGLKADDPHTTGVQQQLIAVSWAQAHGVLLLQSA